MSIYTSIGTPTANSYVSVNSADEYFDARENADGWIDITSTSEGSTTAERTRKENLLIMATREIDRTFRFHEGKYNQGIKGQDTYQNLEFPRFGNVDSDSNVFIPDEVKYATYEQVLWIRERIGKRTTEDGEIINRQIISGDTSNYLKGWINRQVKPSGCYDWQGTYL